MSIEQIAGKSLVTKLLVTVALSLVSLSANSANAQSGSAGGGSSCFDSCFNEFANSRDKLIQERDQDIARIDDERSRLIRQWVEYEEWACAGDNAGTPLCDAARDSARLAIAGAYARHSQLLSNINARFNNAEDLLIEAFEDCVSQCDSISP